MRNQDHVHDSDPLAGWQVKLRDALVSPLDPERIEAVAAGVVAAVGSTTIAATLVAATPGGMTMLETTTAAHAATNATAAVAAGPMGATAGATVTGSIGAKIAAGVLAASLVGGGAAAVTGNLPDAMQSFVADAASHIGLELPRPDVGLQIAGDLDTGLGTGQVIDLGTAGSLSATVDGSAGLLLTGIEEAAGFTASVVSQTSDAVMVRFDSAAETTTVLLTQVDGEIVSSSTTEVHAEQNQGADDGADTSADADVRTSGSIQTQDASVGVESDTSIQIGAGN